MPADLDYDHDFGIGDEIPWPTHRPVTVGGRLSARELEQKYPKQRRDLRCPDCGNPLILKHGKYGIFYGCIDFEATGCKGSHNCHQQTSAPMGIPANAEVKQARRDAHEAFDTLWKDGGLSRAAAYRWLQEYMGLSEEQCHIGLMGKPECEKIIKAVAKKKGLSRFERILVDDDVI